MKRNVALLRDVVGIHSLFSEPDKNGTPAERHLLFGDLDSKRGLTEPQAFRQHCSRVMRAHGVPDLYILESLKGLHLISPWLNSRRHAERFEEDFHEWGADGAHRNVGYWNGGTVLRITPKPGEGAVCIGSNDFPHMPGEGTESCWGCFGTGWTGQVFRAHLTEPRAVAPWSRWSGPHMDFFQERYAIPYPPAFPRQRLHFTDGLRFEAYTTPNHGNP